MSIIQAKSSDSIRLERSDGTSLQIPCEFILAVDFLLRHCAVETEALNVDPVEDDAFVGWEASLDLDPIAHGGTPWGAILALARGLRSREFKQ